MKPNRFWIEIMVLSAAVACAVALFMAIVAATEALASGNRPEQSSEHASESARVQSSAPNAPPRSYEGMVTCSRCGAKHSAKMSRTATDCAVVCVHNGATFALIDGEKVYQLDGDVVALKKLAGQRARVIGVVQGNTIHVSSLEPAS